MKKYMKQAIWNDPNEVKEEETLGEETTAPEGNDVAEATEEAAAAE